MATPATNFPNGISIGSSSLGVGHFINAGPPSNGASGTFATFAGKGSTLQDSTNGNIYRNVGTLASPSWRIIGGDDGQPSRQTLRFSGNVVAGEGFTIGTQLFRFAVVNTDSLKVVANGELNNVTPIVEKVTMTAHGLVAGDLVRLQTEYGVVDIVWDANSFRLKRGVSGSTIATHADGTAIFTEAVPGSVTGVNIGLTATLTPTVATANALADINNVVARHSAPYAAQNPDVNTLVFYTADSAGGTPVASAATPASTETLTNAAFDNATFIAGYAAGNVVTVRRVPTAAEVTAGKMHFPFPFVPTVVAVRVQTTTTLALKVWDGASAVVGNTVTIDNTGATDWAVTDEIYLTVRG